MVMPVAPLPLGGLTATPLLIFVDVSALRSYIPATYSTTFAALPRFPAGEFDEFDVQ